MGATIMLTRIQFLIMALISVATIACYFAILDALINSDIPLRFTAFFWIFGGVTAYAIMHYGYKLVILIGKKRHATLNKSTNDLYNELKNFF
jgi:hypothetical protein